VCAEYELPVQPIEKYIDSESKMPRSRGALQQQTTPADQRGWAMMPRDVTTTQRPSCWRIE
jgi:hypothetical protein